MLAYARSGFTTSTHKHAEGEPEPESVISPATRIKSYTTERVNARGVLNYLFVRSVLRAIEILTRGRIHAHARALLHKLRHVYRHAILELRWL